jgi:DNA polymerase-3 subunit beta
MEFTCEKKDLLAGVSSVEKIVTTRSTLPIIGYILFEAKKNELKISANNLEMGIELRIKAIVNKEGAVLVPAKTFSGIVSKLPDAKVGFKLNEGGTLSISFNKSNFSVHTLPPDEFPVLPRIKEGRTLSLDSKIFVSMIRQTIFAVSANEDKHVLNGVLIEIGKSPMAQDESNFRLISTDGYRLAKRGERVKFKEDLKVKVIVPAKTLQEVLRVIEMDKEENDVKMTFSSDQISFKYKDSFVISRLIQGQFPDYRQVLPKKSTTFISLPTRAILESAERAAVIASGSANIVRFQTGDGTLHLFASTPDVGTVNEVLEAEIKGDIKKQIAFNVRLITDALKSMESEKVKLELGDSSGPGIIREDESNNYLYIVMPIRTQEVS